LLVLRSARLVAVDGGENCSCDTLPHQCSACCRRSVAALRPSDRVDHTQSHYRPPGWAKCLAALFNKGCLALRLPRRRRRRRQGRPSLMHLRAPLQRPVHHLAVLGADHVMFAAVGLSQPLQLVARVLSRAICCGNHADILGALRHAALVVCGAPLPPHPGDTSLHQIICEC
jgi:hypothetical protein